MMALLIFLMPLLPVQAAAGASIRASLPQFPVSINGTKLDSSYSQYPFLLYKDITFMPMTWNNLQALGMGSEWSEEAGLHIWTNKNYPPPILASPVKQDLKESPNTAAGFSVQKAEGLIAINGSVIDNTSEPYPFFTFRDVTYMPLTWRYVHDLLQMDIRWSTTNGLELIGNQNVIGPLIGDDDTSLYFYSMTGDPAKSMMKMDKTFRHWEWLNRDAQDKFIGSLTASPHPYAGKPVELQRKDRNLYYKDIQIYTLTDSDVWESNTWGAPVHTYTLFPAGERAEIITVNLKLQIAAIGPNYGTTHTILIRDGKATELKDWAQKPDRVIPNPDGTVWIAASRLPSRNGYMGGSARLSLLDTDGTVHSVNELLNEADVMALGVTNPALANPAAADGSLDVVLLGRNIDFTTKDSAGLYTISTKLETKRRSSEIYGDAYLDKHRSVFIQHRNNTLENESTGEVKTWFDYELLPEE
ncbi:hypothetical protein CF651_31270 [Paenibacillus rigui]|uniref:Copper amine oxidase-like N-terminal domain-containing protein n=2 Tax=Paenibacillus rigui TaxID=554312 RepID=A0A229UG93_9BACL|nr:hypothetical protein CF651_31270 [Paenibacillus rigui]